MEDRFHRTRLLLGEGNMERLAQARIAVFGIGGVGGYAVEALARSGIGHFVLVDNDNVSITNFNRQIIATSKTLGRSKVEVMKERIVSINPEAEVEIRQCFFLPENAETFDFSRYSYVVDAVDTVKAKLELARLANEFNVPIISSMGTANKLDASKFQAADIYKTSVCPLAKVMRRELKKMGIKSLKVVYSTEEPIRCRAHSAEEPIKCKAEETSKGSVLGSAAFVPPVAGLILAGEVVKDLTGN